ncbi:hypothetical protein [Amycolatopsis jiangsuensis]|uniref:DUF485 domain-containing protein n=1 Tax=Amycolatopsis jiangsuensis TaxID=1181879 RepID=A0A840J0Y1_9PSEU|nr:hypothetical protein [Amycolatopsis jiangsuensis]MBB4687092.1 hypothetical protein [Amycolatopsis jiangsuensis]
MTSSEDPYHRLANGVRKPDPTLGSWSDDQAVVEPVPPAPEPLRAGEPAHVRPKRERVVLADSRQTSGRMRGRVELEEQTSWGKLLVRDLVKVQLRTSVLLSVLVVAVLGVLPVLFYLLPAFARFTLIGIPVPWIVLGLLPFPFLFVVGLWYNRLAERHERDFVDMIEN